MQFFGLKWSKLKYIQWIQSKKLGIYIINRLFLAKSHFALFYLVNLLHKLLGPTATSVLMIGCYNFEGLIISSRYNFGPMSRLIQQLFDFWVHSNSYHTLQFLLQAKIKTYFYQRSKVIRQIHLHYQIASIWTPPSPTTNWPTSTHLMK